jgi:hypothetical protein
MIKKFTKHTFVRGKNDMMVFGTVHYHIDSKYGADADGNRYNVAIFVDDVTDIKAYNTDDEEIELTDKQIDYYASKLGESI